MYKSREISEKLRACKALMLYEGWVLKMIPGEMTMSALTAHNLQKLDADFLEN